MPLYLTDQCGRKSFQVTGQIPGEPESATFWDFNYDVQTTFGVQREKLGVRLDNGKYVALPATQEELDAFIAHFTNRGIIAVTVEPMPEPGDSAIWEYGETYSYWLPGHDKFNAAYLPDDVLQAAMEEGTREGFKKVALRAAEKRAAAAEERAAAAAEERAAAAAAEDRAAAAAEERAAAERAAAYTKPAAETTRATQLTAAEAQRAIRLAATEARLANPGAGAAVRGGRPGFRSGRRPGSRSTRRRRSRSGRRPGSRSTRRTSKRKAPR